MKLIKIEDREMRNAITSGEAYIEIDNRKFMLFEVEQILGPDIYEVKECSASFHSEGADYKSLGIG